MRLAIITTHPIQYYAPLFALLARDGKITVKVFYTWERGAEKYDKGFGKSFSWDIALLEEYDYEFVSNNGNHGKNFWKVRNPQLINSITEWRADSVLVFGWNYRSHLQAMRHFKGRIPVLFRGDSTLLGESAVIKKLARRFFLTWVYKHIDYAFYVGTNNKNYFLKHGVPENRLVFAPHAVDNERFRNSNNDQEIDLWKRELDIPEDSIVFLYAGKLEATKDPLLLIESFKKLQGNNFRLIITGNGKLENEVDAAAGMDQRIKRLPFQNQSKMPAVYRLGDIFVLPSIGESWGLAVNEAMACDRAILASDKVGSATDLVEQGKNGYVFKAGDREDLLEKMKRFEDKRMVGAFGKESGRIIENWSFRNIADSIELLITALPKSN